MLCRQECKKLREELKEEHEEDKTSALAQLALSKGQELSNARESWQRKVEDLLEQVCTSPVDLCRRASQLVKLVSLLPGLFKSTITP